MQNDAALLRVKQLLQEDAGLVINLAVQVLSPEDMKRRYMDRRCIREQLLVLRHSRFVARGKDHEPTASRRHLKVQHGPKSYRWR